MSFDEFAERWPCRDREAQQLIKLLGGNTPPPCVLVSGPRCTGKTGITRYVVNHSGKDYAWVSALQDNTLPAVLSNAVAQFTHQRPCLRDGCGKTTESSTDLLLQLAGVRPFSKLRGVLVLDDADAMASAEGLAVLTRLQELSGANITVVLISSVPWNSGALGKAASSMALEPLEVVFCGYTNAQISQILLQQRPAAARSPELTQLFLPFLQSMLPLFLTASATVADLQVVVDFLWPRYAQPVLDGTVPASDHMRLHALAQPHLDRARTAFRVGLGAVPAEAEQLQLPGAVAAKAASSGSGSCGGQMQWELSFLNKFLLLAAYIASQNPPDHDLQVFDPSAKAAHRKRKDTQDHSRRVEAARQGAKQSAGVSFSLERLLHVFWTLLELEGIPPDSPEPDREWRSMHAGMHCADVLTQINTLVSLKLLARVPGEPVIADMFVCSIPEELATHIASHLSISLDHYIVYA